MDNTKAVKCAHPVCSCVTTSANTVAPNAKQWKRRNIDCSWNTRAARAKHTSHCIVPHKAFVADLKRRSYVIRPLLDWVRDRNWRPDLCRVLDARSRTLDCRRRGGSLGVGILSGVKATRQKDRAIAVLPELRRTHIGQQIRRIVRGQRRSNARERAMPRIPAPRQLFYPGICARGR